MRVVEDWGRVPAAEMADLYRLEQERWQARLDWDTADTWDELERARRNGRLAGLVVRESGGAIAGWTYYALHGGELQIGGLVASSPDITAALLDGALGSPAASVAGRALFFACSEAPGVTALLARRGFDVGVEHYLVRLLAPAPAAAAGAALRAWRDTDPDDVARLLQGAYGGADRRRAYAPSGALAEWRLYVQQLTLTIGCGRFLPALSTVAPAPGGGLDGAALVTGVSSTTAHLAQLAVRPETRGRGLGARLLAAVLAGAATSGYRQLSLLVSATNERARRLYGEAGFTARATFVSATRQRRRATDAASDAPAA